MKYSAKIRNERLNVVASALGPAAVMKIFSGECPSSCAAPDPSGEIVEIELPRRPFHAPQGAKLMISEPWYGSAHADGTAKSFRIFDYLGECHVSGTVSKAGGGGDLQLDTDEIHAGQRISIGAMTLIEFGDVDDEEMRTEMIRSLSHAA